MLKLRVKKMFLTFFRYIITTSTIVFRICAKKFFLTPLYSYLKPVRAEFTLSSLWNWKFFPLFDRKLDDKDITSLEHSYISLFMQKMRNRSAQMTFGVISYKLVCEGILAVWTLVTSSIFWSLNLLKRSVGEGALYLRGLLILFFFDAALTDDEPLWEPIEWSLTQSWIMFIFMFAWIGENLISSRYGSYTGRDKRVWFSWYKTFWLVEGWYLISLGATALFVIIPFYHELTYTLPLIVSWWNWYSRVFIFKFIAVYSLLLYIAYYIQLNIGVFHWRKILFLVLLVNVMLSYLLYTHFFITFFAYFTDPNWYHKTRLIDYIQLSHEPSKWSWGNAKRDHFSYHKSTTVFWFKNDIPFGSAILLFHVMFFICLFTLYLYWLTLFRRIYTTQEVTFTYTTYCISSLRQFYYYFSGIYLLVLFSFVVQYWRSPIENTWVVNAQSLMKLIIEIIISYGTFLCNSCYL